MSSKALVAVLAATTLLASSAAFADQQGSNQQATTPPPGHAAVVKDFDKLSADGVRAYQDLTLARLAIFDGRTSDAKKYVDDADTGFNNAKNDESVFTKAEASMRTQIAQKNGSSASNGQAGGNGGNGNSDAGTQNASNGQSGGNGSNGNAGAQSASNDNSNGNGNGNDVNTPTAWLPVNGAISINEDFTGKPDKAKAMQDANKSLAQGDKKGAMEKLKLADVNTAVTLAVVPLKQTIDNVNQAKQLIDSGKYYEGSQKLRAVQNATVFTIADVSGTPDGNGSQQNAPNSSH